MKNKKVLNKKLCMFLVLFVAATASIFAQSTATAEMNSIVGQCHAADGL